MSQDSSTFSMPDRLAADPSSRYFNQAILERDVGIRFNGVERSDVEEYCISEGWVRVAAGKALDRKGKPLLIKLKGNVEAWVKNPAP
jgi:predicted house-cleaning NTP pyrophosphatase (Maf/HAM1 superfamily)